MRVTLVGHTSYPVQVCAGATSMCYGSNDPEKALRNAVSSGHESVIEHASFTFHIEGISRVTLAQLTRHRLCSYTVVSQRYTGIDGQEIIKPQTVKDAGNVVNDWWGLAIDNCMHAYRAMVMRGVPEEDARYIIPQGITCDLYMTANARELRHIFELRECNRAQWEVRQLVEEMHILASEDAPLLFDGAGAPCVRGACHERRSCGKPRRSK